jgi:hypothetical protein
MPIQQLKVVGLCFLSNTGGTGLSVTNISKLDNGTAFGYDQLLTFNGYINFHQSTNLASLVAQGDIGQNELTGKKVSYVLAQKTLQELVVL